MGIIQIYKMKKAIISLCAIVTAAAATAIFSSCSGKPKQSRCDVEVFSPEKRYSEVKLLDVHGAVIDSTLSVRNDSIIFSRTDSLAMPYIATLRLRNPSDSLDIVYMPIVIEGGTVSLDLTDRISLSGTPDNEALFKFLKAKNSFSAKYERENTSHDVAKLKEDYSKFFADQAILNKGTVVGEYIFETYRSVMTPDDLSRVKERLNN